MTTLSNAANHNLRDTNTGFTAIASLVNARAALAFDDGRELPVDGTLLIMLSLTSPVLEGALQVAQQQEGNVHKLAMPGDTYEGCQHVLQMLDVRKGEPSLLGAMRCVSVQLPVKDVG